MFPLETNRLLKIEGPQLISEALYLQPLMDLVTRAQLAGWLSARQHAHLCQSWPGTSQSNTQHFGACSEEHGEESCSARAGSGLRALVGELI